MIVLDIETSGLIHSCGIWQIGAVNLRKEGDYFFQEARIDPHDVVQRGALVTTGKTERELRDSRKQSQRDLVSNYFDWVEKQEEKIFFGQNVCWDIGMIQARSIKYDFHRRFLDIHGQRGRDLHVLVQEKFFQISGNYSLDERGKSDFNLGKILQFCGLPDEIINIRGEDIIRQGNPHNALEDCYLEGEVLWRLKFGKSLFERFKEFEIPEYLIQ